jgi:hypothetical protein
VTTLLIVPLVFSAMQERAGTVSPSLDPDDPSSPVADRPHDNRNSPDGERP